MSSLLSRAFSRRPSFPRLSCIALLVAGIGLASCGGDDDNPPAVKQADQVGTLHGALAAALQEELGIGAPLTNLATPVDALQDIVILSDPNGIHDAHPALPLMKNAFYSGRAVVLENVNAKEVNTLIKALGVRISAFSPPKGAEFVELFAVRKVKNDTWFFVDLGASWEPSAGDDFQNDWNLFSLDKTASYDSCGLPGDEQGGLPGDEQRQVEIHVCGNDESESSSSADGAEGVRQQAQCETATQALGAPRALSPTLAKAIRANTTPVEETGVDPDCNGRNPNSVCGPMRSRALLDWAQRGREESAKPPQSVVLQNAGDTTPKYEPAAEMNWQFSQTPGGRQFTIRYLMSSYHSFDEHVDYYFISQSGDFSVKNAWRNEPANCHITTDWDDSSLSYQDGYVRFYEFEHALHDYAGGPYDYGFGSHEPVNITYSPVNQNSEYSVNIGTEKGLSGSVGFSAGYSKASSASDADPLAGGPQASASASLGVHINRSTSDSRTYKEASMTFSYPGRFFPKHIGLNWRYDLLRPCSGDECNFLHLGYLGNLQDATKLARDTFTPQHEWTWRVPSRYSKAYFQAPNQYDKDDLSGFMAYFRAVTGKSRGYFNDMHVYIVPTQHVCDQRFDLSFYVPVSRPPLLAVDQSALQDEFPVQGGFRRLKLSSEYYWKVYEKPDWVTVEPMSGEPTGEGNKGTGWDGSVDLNVTVYKVDDFDRSSKNRYGTVKICATDRLDGDCFSDIGGEPIYSDDYPNPVRTIEGEEVWFTVTQTPFRN